MNCPSIRNNDRWRGQRRGAAPGRCLIARLDSRRLINRHRGGNFLIEAVIGVLMLATASYGLVRLARHSADLTLYADTQLAATLDGQNALDRLGNADFEQLPEYSQELSEELSSEAGRDVSIDVIPFQLEDRDGYHLRVRVTVEPEVSVVMNDWRIEAPTNKSVNRDPSVSDELSTQEDSVASDQEDDEGTGSNDESRPESNDQEVSDGEG